MDKIWVIPISLAIIGWFGIFWTMNLSNAELTMEVDLSMDNNTVEAMKLMNQTIENMHSYRFNYDECQYIETYNASNNYSVEKKEYWCMK